MTLLLARFGEWMRRRPLLRFTLAVLALLPAMFLLWHGTAAAVAAPAALVADTALTLWIPEFVVQTYLRGSDLIVESTYTLGGGTLRTASTGDEPLAFAINTRLLSFSVPFYAALFFATSLRDGAARAAWGLITLWLLMGLGLTCVALKDFMVTMGQTFTGAPGIPPADAIALAYQFSTLMVPTLAPILLWAYAARDSEPLASLLGSRRPAHSRD